jgi:hypothetical protein
LPATDSSRDGPSGEDFAHLPSGKLLTDQVEMARFEIVYHWDEYGAPDAHPALGQLWSFTRIAARSRLREDLGNRAATEFLDSVQKIDAELGEPRGRGWRIPSAEADRRFELVCDYLYASGLLSLRTGDKLAPSAFLTEKELRGT